MKNKRDIPPLEILQDRMKDLAKHLQQLPDEAVLRYFKSGAGKGEEFSQYNEQEDSDCYAHTRAMVGAEIGATCAPRIISGAIIEEQRRFTRKFNRNQEVYFGQRRAWEAANPEYVREDDFFEDDGDEGKRYS